MTAPAAYRERAPTGAVATVAEAVWSVGFRRAVDDWLVLPDGCVDLVVVAGAAPIVAGPATTASVHPQSGGACAVGLRLRPGAAPALLGVAANELRDPAVPIDALPRARALGPVLEAIEHARVDEATVALERALPVVAGADQLVVAAAHLLRRTPGRPVAAVAAAVGLSPRQLHRRFDVAVGYGPKRFIA